MSAYTVDSDTLDLLVTAAIDGPPHRRGLRVVHGGTVHTFGADPLNSTGDANVIGQLLHDANVASVNYRYADGDGPGTYTFRRVSGIGGVGVTYWDVITSADCLDYQSCEMPGWGETFAAAVIRAIRDKAVDLLTPEGVAWGWTRQLGADRVAAVADKVKGGRA